MKVGFILECGPAGAETKVIPHLVRMINPLVIPDLVPLDTKRVLRPRCGEYVAELLERGCKKVIILWDLLPDWGEYEGRGCRRGDREEILASLEAAKVTVNDGRVFLVCIEGMLESWLLADERAVGAFLSTPAHPVNVRRCRNPEGQRDAKAALSGIFRQSRSRYNHYIDRDHAIMIAQNLPDLARLRDCTTFNRFEEKLLLPVRPRARATRPHRINSKGKKYPKRS
jgi:hypothetical protein